MDNSIKSRQAKAESLIFNSDGQRPSEQKQKIIEALKGRDQDFALSGTVFNTYFLSSRIQYFFSFNRKVFRQVVLCPFVNVAQKNSLQRIKNQAHFYIDHRFSCMKPH